MGNRKPAARLSVPKNNSNAETLDPTLASLFATSAGPVQSARKRHSSNRSIRQISGPENSEKNPAELEAPLNVRKKVIDNNFPAQNYSHIAEASGEAPNGLVRKRKRRVNRDEDDENLESRYLQSLIHESNEREVGRNKRRQREPDDHVHSPAHNEISSPKSNPSISTNSNSKEELDGVPPQHESLSQSKEKLDGVPPQYESLSQSAQSSELQKASRTVFIGNVSTVTIKSKKARTTLINHLESFTADLPVGGIPHKIESIRFRSTAFSNNGLPKKVAFAKKELMDSTTKSTNAYAVYTTQSAAKEAVAKLNGTVLFDRHLRVDGVAHPAMIDHRRCVFVGNLGFVDDETAINAAKDEEGNQRPRKAREPADAEEGLWRQFSTAGVVESVRVIRDRDTRVGKGFAYIQFRDVNAVEKALLYDGKKFPPMLPRVLRVFRAKRSLANASRTSKSPHKKGDVSASSDVYRPKLSSKTMSLSGRAQKLLGSAGAANLRKFQGARTFPSEPGADVSTPATKVVYEGHRASSKQSQGTMKLGGSGKKQGKPRTRSSRRGAAFKASVKKKTRKS